MFYIIFFLLNQIIFIFSLKYAAVSTLTLSPVENWIQFQVVNSQVWLILDKLFIPSYLHSHIYVDNNGYIGSSSCRFFIVP